MLPTRFAPLHFTTSRTCLRTVANSLATNKRCYGAAKLNRLEPSQLEVKGAVAEQLRDTRVWATKHASRKKADLAYKNVPPPIAGDKTRVNIVSEKLCDDILKYIGKSLEKYKGCDLVDINPGAGLWSRKLNEFLEPRSHVLMETDDELYREFLQPLLKKEGTSLVAKSGIVWKELNSVLNPTYLPHQKPLKRDDDGSNAPNDTLLISVNLTFHPKKKFQAFDSIATLLLHQFMDSIKTASLFHKYGQVRMLVWVRREDKANLLPRLLQKRKRTGSDAELFCQNINEVVGWNGRENGAFTRDTLIDRASAVATLQRMKDAEYTVPKGRETDAHKQAKKDAKHPEKVPSPGTVPPVYERAFQVGLKELMASNPRSGTKEHRTLKTSTWRNNTALKKAENFHDLHQRGHELSVAKIAGTISDDEIQAKEQVLSTAYERMPVASKSEFTTYRDNLHLWQQDEPILLWDRRTHEPLLGATDEFFPNIEACLLDIIPRPVHHLVRDIGPGSSRAGESFELIQKALWAEPKANIKTALDTVWPGASDWIIPRCPSLHDPKQGGVNIDVKGMELTVRTLSAKQWEEILDQWHLWPFRPEFVDLVSRSLDYTEEDDIQAVN
ncbi:hypothetical protein G7054_g609 [Neopestalotiopsis clavispora]|nr:hypothetical protein G7054_g609 [Neopestalotiopsis clavispora]